ncbi:MAG TPA: hypothetical protein VF698_07550 [Thermoanaerobaculia bacterium]|jgi:hypothetical protein
MTTESCERFLEDPEAHAAHLETCADCRAFFAELDAPVAERPIAVDPDALPLAPWEGASHRPWPLVAGVVLAVLAMGIAFFLVAGESPLAGMIAAVAREVPQLGFLVDFIQLTGNAAQHAPATWQIAVGISFVVVNTVLFLLLRRSPRGIDA